MGRPRIWLEGGNYKYSNIRCEKVNRYTHADTSGSSATSDDGYDNEEVSRVVPWSVKGETKPQQEAAPSAIGNADKDKDDWWRQQPAWSIPHPSRHTSTTTPNNNDKKNASSSSGMSSICPTTLSNVLRVERAPLKYLCSLI